ncbi:MAG: pyruvate formate lyase-activating protein [Chloroflexi bacterium]|nr:pyruvate formate lyase-activating protein [Chloroflexota bacterium]
MRALAIDVGTGTQDVFLFDSDRSIENAYRLVLPSPTLLVARAIRRATKARWGVVLSGSTMGGGPSAWAARDHAAAGLPISATASAARTIDDDLETVAALGVRIIDDAAAEDAATRTLTLHLALNDVWLAPIAEALSQFDIDLRRLDALAIAVFDHGSAPVGVSDRRFRFERLRECLSAEPDAGPLAFAFLDHAIPTAFTRLRAAADAARSWLGPIDAPILVMDTGPAAVLGALEDEAVRGDDAPRSVVAVNVGNFHALGMRLSGVQPGPAGEADLPPGQRRIDALFEHHTGELDADHLVRLVTALADGSLDDDAVFDSLGHGAFVRQPFDPGQSPLLLVTGPRRSLLAGRPIDGLATPGFAAPHGDMMQTGCFGLLRGLAHRLPEWREPVEGRLGRAGQPVSLSAAPAPAPWDA